MEHGSKEGDKKHNRLIYEKSPYLLQHAGNPVDWYPWGDEAFEAARKEEKPIFLSIGYSTCHWCHVMERESFEDEETARLLNDVFIPIKVDREERPDIDGIYMTACQMLTGTGGWPLTILMTPDHKPFFAATYIPRTGRFGRPGLVELIPQVKTLWQTKRAEITGSADRIADRLLEISSVESGDALGEQVLRSAYESLSQQFDARHGGFGSAPKFPTPHTLLFLLRYARRANDSRALEMVESTLRAMRLGGIFDHIGFGFHRYSTDAAWLVPHFEKMLYDQAMLAMAYLEAYQTTHEEMYAQTAREIFTYVLRDMRSEAGGFYSAEDADSEGEEGKFYLWSEAAMEQLLGKEEARLMATVFNTQPAGNFADEAAGRGSNGNILHLTRLPDELAPTLGFTAAELAGRIDAVRGKLFTAREGRVHPSKDDKVLTDWNGLMIAAMARGAQVLDEPAYAEAARKAVQFILDTMRDKNGRLFHRFRDGEVSIQGNLDDYAFVTWGLIELYELTFESQYLRHAVDLTDLLIARFWDEEQGGFFFTPDDGEPLLIRQKDIYDGAIPSGNSVSMLNLLRLGRMTGRVDLEEKGARMASSFSRKVEAFPAAFTQLLVGIDFSCGPAHEVVITGQPGAPDTAHLVCALRTHFIPNKVVLFRPANEEHPGVVKLAPFTRTHTPVENRATAFVCSNYACRLPTNDAEEMLRMLGAGA